MGKKLKIIRTQMQIQILIQTRMANFWTMNKKIYLCETYSIVKKINYSNSKQYSSFIWYPVVLVCVVFLTVRLSVCLSVCLPVWLAIYLPVCIFICLFVSLPVCLFLYLCANNGANNKEQCFVKKAWKY